MLRIAYTTLRCWTSRWLAVAVVVVYCLPLAAQSIPSPRAVPEYRLKAAFVYNFALFTEWPANALGDGGVLHVCTNPDSALRPALEELADKTVKGHRIELVRLLGESDPVSGCHILFLDALDREHWIQIRKNLDSASVLTVTDDPEIGRGGAVIALQLSDNRIVFDIDKNAARQARLILSSKLLRLARTVK